MKRILITTFGDGNYGTYLQCYALCKAIKDLGHKVNILTSYPKISFRRFLIVLLKKLNLLKLYLKYIKRFNETKVGLSIKKFKSKDLNLIELYYPFQLKHIASTYDIYITGSDQIWNTYFNYEPKFFLSYVKNRKKIAYSSSLGTSNINPKHRDKIKYYLSDFSHIAVREETAKQLLADLLKREVYRVIDPVFLLTLKDWETFGHKSDIVTPPSYGICYCIANNDKYLSQTKNVMAKSDTAITLYIPSMENPLFWQGNNESDVLNDIDLYDFVKLLFNASYICTDSFHATALAIIFNKPFTVLKRFDDNVENSQNSRIYDLLTRYGLSDRIYDETNDEFSTESIEYSHVNKIVADDVKDSLHYLTGSIND